MKHQLLALGILLVQGWMHNAAAKPLSLYRIDENSVSNSETKTRQLDYSIDAQQSAGSFSDEYVEDFSAELYDEANIPSERMLYQSEVEKLIKERRDMFTRNLQSMSVSLSFNVIIAPPSNPTLIESGDEEETPYDVLREKLLGEDAKDEDDEASIETANEIAGGEDASPSNHTVLSSGDNEESSYDVLREKLLGEDAKDEDDEASIEKANEIAGGEEDEESSYDILRVKLLGEDAEDEDDEASIEKANEIAASEEEKVIGLMLTETVETETDYSAAVPETKTGYIGLRSKLLGKGDDEEFEEEIEEELKQADDLAADKDIVGGGPKKNLRHR